MSLDSSESIFDFLDEMRESGIPEEIVSRKVNFFLQKKARQTDTPYRGHFELTPLCNLNCKMCYVHLNIDQMNGRRLLLANEWADLIKQSIDAGMIKATLSGGECLTYPWFDEVFLLLKSRSIITTVLTNAVLLDNEKIRFFQKHLPGKIQISLYGSSDNAYEKVTGKRVFSTVLNNIIAAKEANLPIKISITPSRYMLDDFEDIIKLINEINVPFAINIGLMTPRPGTGRDTVEHDISVDDYIEIIKYNRVLQNKNPEPTVVASRPDITDFEYVNKGLKCGAGRSTFSINWFGVMNPCTQMSSIAANPLEKGFLSSWKLINEEVKVYPRFTACANCTYNSVCDFCAAENEKMGSKFILNQRWCERTWKMVENGLRSISNDSKCDL